MPEETPLLSVDEFADSVKKKYPKSVYANYGNTELTNLIVAKYPVYKSKVDMATAGPTVTDLMNSHDATAAFDRKVSEATRKYGVAGKGTEAPISIGQGGQSVRGTGSTGTATEDLLGLAKKGTDLIEKPLRMAKDAIAGMSDEEVVSQLFPLHNLIAKGINKTGLVSESTAAGVKAGAAEVGRRSLDVGAGLLLDLKNAPFLLAGGAAPGVVRPAIRLAADAFMVGLSQAGAVNDFARVAKEYDATKGPDGQSPEFYEQLSSGTMQQAFALMGAHGMAAQQKAAVLEEAFKREGVAREKAAIEADAVAVEKGRDKIVKQFTTMPRMNRAQRRAATEVPDTGEPISTKEIPEDPWGILKKEAADRETAKKQAEDDFHAIMDLAHDTGKSPAEVVAMLRSQKALVEEPAAAPRDPVEIMTGEHERRLTAEKAGPVSTTQKSGALDFDAPFDPAILEAEHQRRVDMETRAGAQQPEASPAPEATATGPVSTPDVATPPGEGGTSYRPAPGMSEAQFAEYAKRAGAPEPTPQDYARYVEETGGPAVKPRKPRTAKPTPLLDDELPAVPERERSPFQKMVDDQADGVMRELQERGQGHKVNPVSLVELIKQKGGIKDPGGDLKSRELDKGNKPFQRNFIQQKTGMEPDKAREMLVEAGYLPEGADLNALLDAIDAEFRGKPTYSRFEEHPFLGSPLEGFKETPQEIVDALAKGKGKLYEKARNAIEQEVLVTHGDDINAFLETASPEHIAEVLGEEPPAPAAADDTPDWVTEALSSDDGPTPEGDLLGEGGETFQEGERTSDLGQTEKEGLSNLVGGRRPELLKEGKVFDDTRLVESELFGGRGGRQGFLGTDERAPEVPKRTGPTYEEVLEASRQAARDYEAAQTKYRAREIGDDEFIAARERFVASQEAFDAARGESAPGGNLAATAFPSKANPGNTTRAAKSVVKNAMAGARERVNETAGDFAEAADDIRKTFSPAKRKGSSTMAGLIRETAAELAARDARAARATAEARDMFQKAGPVEGLKFIDAIESGKKMPTVKLQEFADTMRSMREELWVEVQKRSGIESWIQDYWPHFWKDPRAAEAAIGKYFSKRPLLGSKDFLHKREIPTVRFGVEELGLKPAFDNPVDAFMTQMHSLNKYILFKDMLQEAKDLGVIKFHSVLDGRRPEAGMTRLADPVGTVYGPPEVKVKEAYDENMFTQINDFARSLGIRPFTKMETRGGVWGWTRRGESAVYRRFAGPETVVTHEIGHQLDFRYGLADRLVKNPLTRDELRTLADMRFEGAENRTGPGYRKYVRKGTEKIANLVHAIVHTPERAAEVAPNSVQILRELAMFHPELRPLFEIKPSLVLGENAGKVRVNGQVVIGHLYAPEPAARIMNNYLSPGLQGKVMYRGLRWIANTLNQAQLGFSAFHALFTTLDATVSDASLAAQQFSAGQFKGAAKNAGKAASLVGSTIENLAIGSKVLKEFYKPGSQGQFYADTVDRLIKAGGRVSMEEFYHNNAVEQFWDSWHAGKVSAPLRALPAVIEYSARPIMKHLVPRQKLAVFAKLAEFELSKLPENASVVEQREVLGRAWDSVDNRMGQMVYDNLFWNKAVKDLGLVSVRSLGWNLGTKRELIGGAADVARAFVGKGEAFSKGKFELTPRMAYSIALPFTIGLYGAVLNYLFTGKGPQSVEDYFFVPTGNQNPDGTPERISLPTYMKDAFQYQHDFPYGAAETLSHKVNPAISMVMDMLRNKDFYGTEIRHEGDPLLTQAKQSVDFVASQFIPFSGRNMQQRAEADATILEQAESFVGILPAPKWVDRTPAEQLASRRVSLLLPRGARTQEEFDRSRLRGQIVRDIQLKKPGAQEKLQTLLKSGRLTRTDSQSIISDVSKTYLQRMVSRLGLVDAIDIYEKANAEERKSILPVVLQKAPLLQNLPEETQDAIKARIDKIMRDRPNQAANRAPSTLPAAPTRISSPMTSH